MYIINENKIKIYILSEIYVCYYWYIKIYMSFGKKLLSINLR